MMDDEMLLLLLLATQQHDDNHALDSSFYSALDIQFMPSQTRDMALPPSTSSSKQMSICKTV
jgi:membrane-bound lytic murein transglycosylase B